MRIELLESWINTLDAGLESLLHHPFAKPPYGYVIGVVLWPLYISTLSVWAILLQFNLPSTIVTLGVLIIGIGGFVTTTMSSILITGATAWNTPYERIRRQFALLVLPLLLAVPLFSVYQNWQMEPYGYELGLSTFAAHELSKIVFLGPATGCAFLLSPLVVFLYRIFLKDTSNGGTPLKMAK